MQRIPLDEVHKQLTEILLRYGCSENRANLCARLFTETTLDGVYSHGLNRFPRFIEYIKKGHVKVDALPKQIGRAHV